jgi:O-antigen/teichoic acid export membrane protein
MNNRISEEETKNNLKLLAKSSIVILIGVFLAKIFTYLYRIIIARYYGPEIYGFFNLSIMIVGWLISFSGLGLGYGLLKYIPIFRAKKHRKKISSIFRFSFKTVFLISILAGVLLFLFSDNIALGIFHESELSVFLKFFSIAVPLTVILEIFLAVFTSYEEYAWYTFIHKFLIGFLKLILIGVFIFIGLNSDSVFHSYNLGLFLSLVFAFFLFKYKFPFVLKKNPVKKNKKLYREIFHYSWPLLFYGVVWQVFHWTDSFVLGYFKTASDVGIYNAAVPIAFLLMITPSLFMHLFFPMVNRELAKGNKSTVKQLSKQVGKWIFLINLPAVILLIFFPGAFLNILFGSQYISAENSLRILGIGVFFFSIFDVSHALMRTRKKTKIVLFNVLGVFVINLILNILFIPKYGIVGAALSTTISLIILSFIFGFQTMKYLSILPLRRKMLNLLIASLISTGVLFYLKSYIAINIISLIILVSFFLIFYILLAFLFKSLDRNDIMIIKSFLKKLKFK